MANLLKLELNTEGVKALLRGPEMQECVEHFASQVAQNAGEGYSYDSALMPTRWIASAYADSERALEATMLDDELLRGLNL